MPIEGVEGILDRARVETALGDGEILDAGEPLARPVRVAPDLVSPAALAHCPEV